MPAGLVVTGCDIIELKRRNVFSLSCKILETAGSMEPTVEEKKSEREQTIDELVEVGHCTLLIHLTDLICNNSIDDLFCLTLN